MLQTLFLPLLACALIGYSLGCINPAVAVGRLKGYDPKRSGSGNPGASNTVIMAGKRAGLFVALFDILKAAAACRIAAALFPDLRAAAPVAGAASILGHMFPLPLRFRGGKGLACLGGVILAYDVRTLLLMLSLAILIGLITKYVCIVTAAMSAVWPVYYGLVTGFWIGAAIFAIPFVPVLLRHAENFRRIRSGEELRLSFLWNKAGELERIGRSEDEK